MEIILKYKVGKQTVYRLKHNFNDYINRLNLNFKLAQI